jgi:hypothetical protein
MNNYQCHIMISNRSATHLTYDKSKLDYGEFRDGHEPATDIPPKSNDVLAFVAQGSPGMPTGTEGTVYYRFEDDQNVVLSIYFDVPTRPFSTNAVTVTSSNPDVAAMIKGFDGSGSTEACTVTIIDGR